MKTKLLQLNLANQDITSHPGLKEAGEILRLGGLVAFPTETVYGLGANGLDPQAVHKIYQAKGRPSDNPLILHIVELDQLAELVKEVSDQVLALQEKFLPGPLTLVLPKKERVPAEVTGGLDTVAVRMPSHPIARELIRTAGVPIAAPSANRSGRPSPTLAEHVIQDLWGRVEMIIDGGSCQRGIESTVLDLTEKPPLLLRPGSISVEELARVLGPVEIAAGVREQLVEKSRPKSPGMKYRHYSPEAELMIIQGEKKAVAKKMIQIVNERPVETGLLVTSQLAASLRKELPETVIKIMGDVDDLETIGTRLFKLLREFDSEGVELVLVEGLSHEGVGLAVMNRLQKAAGYQIMEL